MCRSRCWPTRNLTRPRCQSRTALCRALKGNLIFARSQAGQHDQHWSCVIVGPEQPTSTAGSIKTLVFSDATQGRFETVDGARVRHRLSSCAFVTDSRIIGLWKPIHKATSALNIGPHMRSAAADAACRSSAVR